MSGALRIRAAAGALRAEMEQGRGTPEDLAAGLEARGLVQSPETADEVARLRAEVRQWQATYGREALPGALARLERAENDVAGLRAQVAELETLAKYAVEYRVPSRTPGGPGLMVRRSLGWDGPYGWAVVDAVSDSAVRRAWTAAGWQMSAGLSHAEVHCWPTPEVAMAEALRLAGAAEPATGPQPDTARDDQQTPAGQLAEQLAALSEAQRITVESADRITVQVRPRDLESWSWWLDRFEVHTVLHGPETVTATGRRGGVEVRLVGHGVSALYAASAAEGGESS